MHSRADIWREYALAWRSTKRSSVDLPFEPGFYRERFLVTNSVSASELLEKELRIALWRQFHCLLSDILFLPFVALTVALAPLRIPNLCRIAAMICKYRCSGCGGMLPATTQNLYDADTASANIDIEMSAAAATGSGRGTGKSGGGVGEEKNNTSHNVAALPVKKLPTSPYWDGRSRVAPMYKDGFWRQLVLDQLENGIWDLIALLAIVATVSVAPHRIPHLCRIAARLCHGGNCGQKNARPRTESNDQQFDDGVFRALVFHELRNGIVDLVYIIAAIPAIATLYRWDKLLLPIFSPKKQVPPCSTSDGTHCARVSESCLTLSRSRVRWSFSSRWSEPTQPFRSSSRK